MDAADLRESWNETLKIEDIGEGSESERGRRAEAEGVKSRVKKVSGVYDSEHRKEARRRGQQG